jgi:nucleoside-diphosphate-sugar epimerase
MKISISGLGFLGLPLAELLKGKGHAVHGTTTTNEKLSSLRISAETLLSPALPSEKLLHCDILILNIPPFPGQLSWLASWDLKHVGKIIFVSSTSVFRNSPNSELLKSEEEWVKNSGLPWLIVRPAGLVGHGRHPGNQLSGRKGIPGRLSPVNLIHVEDVCGFLATAIEKNLEGKEINLVSDEHSSKEDFYREFSKRMGLPLPEFDPDDLSAGKIIDNLEMKKYYALKFPTMLGRSL